MTAFAVQAGAVVGDGPLAAGGCVGGALVAVGLDAVFVGVRVGLEVASGVTVGNDVGVAGSGVVVTGT